jgi:hypothetical protein
MLRLLLISSLFALFLACSSSDDPDALKEWFNSQGLATSYGKDSVEIEISVKEIALGFDSSVYMVSSYAALGNANGTEHLLYFGLDVLGSLQPVWKLRTDNAFYAEFPGSSKPDELTATIYWLRESQFLNDSLWLNYLSKFEFPNDFTDSEEIKLEWKAGEGHFSVPLPEKLLEFGKTEPPDTLRLLVGMRLESDNPVVRIAPPTIWDIRNLLRVAQKTNKPDDCSTCLHAGVRESLLVTFEMKDKEKMASKTVVFAQLIFPKQGDAADNSELGLPVPIYVYVKSGLDDYRIDTVNVKNDGHPNLVFWENGDSLRLQVTRNLRNYTATADLPNTLDITLRLGFPMLDPKSLYFYNFASSPEKVFAERPAYARYDFSAIKAGETAKLRLWLADYGDKK